MNSKEEEPFLFTSLPEQFREEEMKNNLLVFLKICKKQYLCTRFAQVVKLVDTPA